MSRIDDALDGLSAREVEELREKIDRRLQACAIDGVDGAVAVRITWRQPSGTSVIASLLLCPACLERHRLPEGRAS